jgi:hypothetical protein
MARRNGWAACVVGLHTCVLAGCLHTDPQPSTITGNTRADQVTDVNPSEPKSPYAVRPTETSIAAHSPPAEPTKPAADQEIKRTSQPVIEKPGSPEEPFEPAPPQILPPIGPPKQFSELPISIRSAAKEPEESPLVSALRFVLSKKASEAFDSLQAYDKPTQEILLALLPLAARLSEGGLDKASPQEIAVIVEQQDRLANLLRGRTALSLERACFARRIDGFGQYDPLPGTPVFTAGSDGHHGDRTLFYAEVKNFLNKFDGKLHKIHLTAREEVYGSDGQLRGGRNLRDEPTYSLSPRQDVFVSFRFSPPPNLRPGSYYLVVAVRDESTAAPGEPARVARCKVQFRIADAGPISGEK